MTTNQYFKMELPLNVTSDEMAEIINALFIAERHYRKKDYIASAEKVGKLFEKIYEKSKEYEEYFK